MNRVRRAWYSTLRSVGAKSMAAMIVEVDAGFDFGLDCRIVSAASDTPVQPVHPKTIEELSALVGVELGPTAWLAVDQARIDEFASATGDAQWIHVDAQRAGDELGSTIAHGLLTLSLGVKFLGELVSFDGFERT